MKRKYVIHGADGQDYGVEAYGYEVINGALLFGDEKGDLVIAYGPNFWDFVSAVDAE